MGQHRLGDPSGEETGILPPDGPLGKSFSQEGALQVRLR